MTLPSYEEALAAEARAHAREIVRQIRDGKIMFYGVPLSWFEKADGRLWTPVVFKQIAATPEGLIDLCHLGRAGIGLAHETLCDLILEYRHNRVPLPLSLEAYDSEVVRASREASHRYHRIRGKQKADFFLRDLAITAVVGDVCWKFGLKPTRSAASKREMSGCSIVARAMADEGLAIGEHTVVKVWTKYGHIAFPGGKFRRETYELLTVRK